MFYSLAMLHGAYFGKAKSQIASQELQGCRWRQLFLIILLLVVLLVLLGLYPQPVFKYLTARLAISSSGLSIPFTHKAVNRHDNNSTKPDRTATVADRRLDGGGCAVLLPIRGNAIVSSTLASRLLGLTRRWLHSGLYRPGGRYGRYAADAR